MQKWIATVTTMVVALVLSPAAMAAGETSGSTEHLGYIGLGAGLAIGLAALGGSIGQGLAAKGTFESISRNPETAGALQPLFFIGMALVESLVIFAFVVAMMLIGTPGVGA